MQDFASFTLKLNEALKHPKIQIKEKHTLFKCPLVLSVL